MTVPVWYVSFAGLCLFLTGVSGEVDSSRTATSPDGRQESPTGKSSASAGFVQTAGDVFAFACASVCGNAGKVLECELKTNGNCAKRYYIVCRGKDQCQWETVRSSCDEEKTETGECERLLRNREEESAIGKLRKTGETGMSYLKSLGIVPALRRKFNSVRRRDLGEQQLYSGRSSMTMTSGNGHAYAVDGGKLVESHYGRPSVITPLQGNDVFGYPYPYVNPFQSFNSLTHKMSAAPPGTGAVSVPSPQGDETAASGMTQEPNPMVNPQQTVNNWSGYQPVPFPPMTGYNAIGPYPTMYQQPSKYGQAFAYGTDARQPPNDHNIWRNRVRPYSPFTTFFNSVGLQDPMLMLHYMPIG